MKRYTKKGIYLFIEWRKERERERKRERDRERGVR